MACFKLFLLTLVKKMGMHVCKMTLNILSFKRNIDDKLIGGNIFFPCDNNIIYNVVAWW
jgi:hypothetical protein